MCLSEPLTLSTVPSIFYQLMQAVIHYDLTSVRHMKTTWVVKCSCTQQPMATTLLGFLTPSLDVHVVLLHPRMSGGPSPFIPLLLVAALSVFLCWEDLVNCYGFVSKIQDATITIAIVTIVAITTLFIVQSMTELIIVPLAFLLVVFLLRTELIGPLVILILIHFLGKFFCCSSEKTPSFWEGEQESKDGGGGGLGWFLFVILCLLLYAWFYEGEGYGWICLVFGMAFILYFNML